MSAPATERTFRVTSVSTYVDVDIDEQLLEENGYHHEDDCPNGALDDLDDELDVEGNRQKLRDWHDAAHGLSPWANCSYEPCKILTDEFRSSR